jgi:hypothetical protein
MNMGQRQRCQRRVFHADLFSAVFVVTSKTLFEGRTTNQLELRRRQRQHSNA